VAWQGLYFASRLHQLLRRLGRRVNPKSKFASEVLFPGVPTDELVIRSPDDQAAFLAAGQAL
jgi:hypothetical protein